MKCRIIREDVEVNVAVLPEELRDQTVSLEVWRNGEMHPATFWKLGGIIAHPEAYLMVRQGCAEPADDECTKRAARTSEQQRAAQYAYERLSRGIHPEDFEKYDAGYISGYNPDGSYIPGPNWAQMPQETEEDDE